METVVRIRPSVTDKDQYGDPPTATLARKSLRCAVAPRTSSESAEAGRQGVIVGFTVYAPPGSDVRRTDQLLIRGEVHEVEGEPGTWVNPFTDVVRGQEIATRRAVG